LRLCGFAAGCFVLFMYCVDMAIEH
jgi:hypothetical protein